MAIQSNDWIRTGEKNIVVNFERSTHRVRQVPAGVRNVSALLLRFHFHFFVQVYSQFCEFLLGAHHVPFLHLQHLLLEAPNLSRLLYPHGWINFPSNPLITSSDVSEACILQSSSSVARSVLLLLASCFPPPSTTPRSRSYSLRSLSDARSLLGHFLILRRASRHLPSWFWLAVSACSARSLHPLDTP